MVSLVEKYIQIQEGINPPDRWMTKFNRYLLINPLTKSIQSPYIYYRDLKNKIIHGLDAPIWGEKIWVNPSDIDMALPYLCQMRYSGRVINTWPPNNLQPVSIMDFEKIRACVDHFVNGIAWENTGAYEHMATWIARCGMMDGCVNQDDVIDRYKRIDALFDQIKMERKIRTRKDINPRNFRERDGIYVHVGPGGKLFVTGQVSATLPMA